MAQVFAFLLFGLLILLVVGGIFSVFKDIFIYSYWEARYFYKKYQPLSQKHRQILNKYSAYYKLLPNADKNYFETRVQRFIYSKSFIPRGIDGVTPEMKVLIAASAIQLTFGLPAVYLSNFDKILIYPDSYYSHITKKYHLGEVNPRAGVIILSWRSFVDGYSNLKDSLNVGIHEMAHAIHFENQIKNDEYDFLDMKLLEQLRVITNRELPGIRTGDQTFLREYAGTNEYEFFAVALEHFFEQPKEFKEAIPDLYLLLTRLLNQDPIKLYKLG